MDKNQPEKPHNVLPDLIIPVMALAFAVYYLTTITGVPWIAQASAVVVSGLLLASILAFGVRTIYRLRLGSEVLRFTGHLKNPGLILRRLGLLALTIGYVWIIDSWGFTVTTSVFLLLSIILLSSPANWRRALIVSLACSVVGYVVFIYIFETRFPEGPIEHFIKEVRRGS
ncbi:MAG: tripartite tricarboxylate transporter TctB family protein [Paracoccaceae bacterium]